MATASLPCEIFLAENGDLVRVATMTGLKATFGVPEREAVETVPGVLLFAEPGSFLGKHKYALLTSNRKTVVTIGEPMGNIKKGVMATGDGATGEAAHNGEGEWYYFN
ncbi:hypothetical protein FRC10_004311 [Ceratobasidium sp. 414]|nr:hypothetical protein FRC10_004311 [Ceratobasidium sp. 414]